MKENTKQCILYDNKICTNCNECNVCDLDPDKLCDNCGKCLGIDASDFMEVEIEGIVYDDEEIDDYILEEQELEKLHKLDGQFEKETAGDYVFIDDIPELKKKYDKQIKDILKGIE